MRISKGSPEQLLRAAKAKLAELGGIEECSDVLSTSDVSGSAFPVDEVLDFLATKGYDISNPEVKQYAEGVAEYIDMSHVAYANGDMDWPYTLEQWYADTQQNYPDDLAELPMIDAACNSANIMAADLDEESQMVWDIAQDFAGYSYPITDSWNHDTLLEMGAIANKLGCSLQEAADKMIDILGFEPEDVDIDKLAEGENVDHLLSKYLDNVVEGASSNNPYTKDSDEVTYDVVEASAASSGLDDSDNKYLAKLQSKLDTWARDEEQQGYGAYVNSIRYEADERNLYVIVTTTDKEDTKIHKYIVPFDDLSFDYDEIESDLDYILDEILKDIPSSDDIESSSEVRAASYDEFDTSVSTDDWELLDEKLVMDADGTNVDYTLYKYTGDPDDVDGQVYICMFGDQTYNPPNFDRADFTCADKDEAQTWFDLYEGFDYSNQ